MKILILKVHRTLEPGWVSICPKFFFSVERLCTGLKLYACRKNFDIILYLFRCWIAIYVGVIDDFAYQDISCWHAMQS